MKVVALLTDAFGGRGGVALYGRHVLAAVCAHPEVEEVIALPRSVTYELESMPENLVYDTRALDSKLAYGLAVMDLARRARGAEVIICLHLNLLPFARYLASQLRCPLLPFTYGRDAWEPTRYRITNHLCQGIEAFVSIRRLTAQRFKSWARIPNARFHYLPNCIETELYGPGPARPELVAKYRLDGRTVVMTAGRIEAAQWEPYKGFDEVIETLPLLARDVPNISYLVMGDGDGIPSLVEKARALGVADRVVFTGYVHEREKADHYRLADVVAMPGSSPNFDRYPFRFAFLEPLACGIPVVGSRLIDESEKDDPDAAELVIQVNPEDREDVHRGIINALKTGKGVVNPTLAKFSFSAFREKLWSILSAETDQRGYA